MAVSQTRLIVHFLLRADAGVVPLGQGMVRLGGGPAERNAGRYRLISEVVAAPCPMPPKPARSEVLYEWPIHPVATVNATPLVAVELPEADF